MYTCVEGSLYLHNKAPLVPQRPLELALQLGIPAFQLLVAARKLPQLACTYRTLLYAIARRAPLPLSYASSLELIFTQRRRTERAAPASNGAVPMTRGWEEAYCAFQWHQQ